jgi:hypothetical protein
VGFRSHCHSSVISDAAWRRHSAEDGCELLKHGPQIFGTLENSFDFGIRGLHRHDFIMQPQNHGPSEELGTVNIAPASAESFVPSSGTTSYVRVLLRSNPPSSFSRLGSFSFTLRLTRGFPTALKSSNVGVSVLSDFATDAAAKMQTARLNGRFIQVKSSVTRAHTRGASIADGACCFLLNLRDAEIGGLTE